MYLFLIGLIMANGVSFAPDKPDDEQYTPEQLYTYLVFADNYVKSKDISKSKFNPEDERDEILNTDRMEDMETLVSLALAEHHDKGYSTGYSQNRVRPPNTNGSIDYGLWQINGSTWEKELKLIFPEMFDNGRDFIDNVSNPFINAVAAIYIAGYVEGSGPNGAKNWSTYGMVGPDSDFGMDAKKGIENKNKLKGDLMNFKDFRNPELANKILDASYGSYVEESMDREARNIEKDFANFNETQLQLLDMMSEGIATNDPNKGYNKMRLRQMVEGM